jgi:hypothetical protein
MMYRADVWLLLLAIPGMGHGLSPDQREELDTNGHIVLPAALTPETTQRCIDALTHIEELQREFNESALGRRKAEIQRLLQKHPNRTEERELRRELREWGPDGSMGLRMSIGQLTAENNEYLESIVGHPEMLALARSVLGDELRFDHQW